MADIPPELAALRTRLDLIDDDIHALVMRRAEVVQQVGRSAAKGAVKLRPGREAAILRRLLARHSGGFPPAALALLWRQIINGNTALQAPWSIAVCNPEGAAYTALAREQYGALTPLRSYRTPAQAIGDVRAGQASAAILPVPSEAESPSAAWWAALLHQDGPRLHITARLPFLARRPEGAPKEQAFVVSTAAPDPSGDDRSLLAFEVPPDQGRARTARLLAAAGLAPGQTILRSEPGRDLMLVDVAGFLTEADPRLRDLGASRTPPTILGAYAVPYEGAM